jgi:hypothetical protein
MTDHDGPVPGARSGHDARLRPTTRDVLACAAAGTLAVLAYALAAGDITKAFAEGRPGTYLSMALLLATAVVSFGIRRRRMAAGARSTTTLIWLLIGVGFVFLALDEGLEIHERLDLLIHSVGSLEETAATDRIDDVIILSYGFLGLAALILWRREIMSIPGLVRFLAWGLALMVLQVGFDALSNGESLLLRLGVPSDRAETVRDLIGFAEDFTKIAAEAVFLAGFLHALRVVAGRPLVNSASGKMKT